MHQDEQNACKLSLTTPPSAPGLSIPSPSPPLPPLLELGEPTTPPKAAAALAASAPASTALPGTVAPAAASRPGLVGPLSRGYYGSLGQGTWSPANEGLHQQKRKEKENYVGRGNSPYINSGKGDTGSGRTRCVCLKREQRLTTGEHLGGDAWSVGICSPHRLAPCRGPGVSGQKTT
eukprot:1158610-Pelagomonas_calceolata.AAC.15